MQMFTIGGMKNLRIIVSVMPVAALLLDNAY